MIRRRALTAAELTQSRSGQATVREAIGAGESSSDPAVLRLLLAIERFGRAIDRLARRSSPDRLIARAFTARRREEIERNSRSGRRPKFNRAIQDEVDRIVRARPSATTEQVFKRISDDAGDDFEGCRVYRDGCHVIALDCSTGREMRRIGPRGFRTYVRRARKELGEELDAKR